MNEQEHHDPREDESRRWSLRLNMAVAAIFLSMLSIVMVGAYSVIQGHQERDNLCQVQNSTREVMRSILADALAFQIARAGGADQVDPEVRAYYERQIARVAPVDCENFLEGEGIHVPIP